MNNLLIVLAVMYGVIFVTAIAILRHCIDLINKERD